MMHTEMRMVVYVSQYEIKVRVLQLSHLKTHMDYVIIVTSLGTNTFVHFYVYPLSPTCVMTCSNALVSRSLLQNYVFLTERVNVVLITVTNIADTSQRSVINPIIQNIRLISRTTIRVEGVRFPTVSQGKHLTSNYQFNRRIAHACGSGTCSELKLPQAPPITSLVVESYTIRIDMWCRSLTVSSTLFYLRSGGAVIC